MATTKKAAPKVVKAVKAPAKATKSAPAAAKKAAAKPVVKPAAKPASKVAAAPAKKGAAVVAKAAVVKPAPKPAAKPIAAPKSKTVVPVAAKAPVKAKAEAKTAITTKQKPAMPEKATNTKSAAKKAEPKAKPAAAKAAEPIKEVEAAPVAKPAAKKAEPAKPVKVPKISTATKVPYDPDFTHSVLDKPSKKDEPVTSPASRYSDSDLAEFRELILRKLEAAKKELNYLQGLITRKDEMGGDNDDARYMTMEDGSLSMEREQLSQMASRQIQFIDHLEKAMMRIENKTYGVCRVTGKLIDKARLRAVPHATLSMEAKVGKVRAV